MIGAIINTILDPVFIFVFGWGIKGAAWATVIGQVVSGILVVVYFWKFRKMYLEKFSGSLSVRSLRQSPRKSAKMVFPVI